MMNTTTNQSVPTAIEPTFQGQMATSGIRAAGYLLDAIPACLLGLFALIPFVGPIIAGLFLFPYWLFRDVTGRSVGKTLLGLTVVGKDGSKAPVGARVLRNLPIAIGPGMLIIPVIGYILAPLFSIPLMLTEIILLLTQGNRLGDRLAGTTVARK